MQPKTIDSAPKDGTEILAFREDAGWFMARWDCAASFLNYREIGDLGLSDDDLYDEGWFCADFAQGAPRFVARCLQRSLNNCLPRLSWGVLLGSPEEA